MDFAIISSEKDLASINIRNNLINNFNFQKSHEKFDNNNIYHLKTGYNNAGLYLISDELIYADDLDKKINADFFVFASRHVSKENTPAFTAHSIGNWGRAEFGGKANTLCPSSAILLKKAFLGLVESAKGKRGYETALEATHHGPFIEKPALFMEIGSTEREWADEDNGRIISNAIIKSIKDCEYAERNDKTAIGLGGTHYCNNFAKIIQRKNIAFSYICPKHSLEKLDGHMLNEAVSKTKEKADFFVLDWKGLGQEKQRIVKLLQDAGIEYQRDDAVLRYRELR